jgi:hypothetical protein
MGGHAKSHGGIEKIAATYFGVERKTHKLYSDLSI